MDSTQASGHRQTLRTQLRQRRRSLSPDSRLRAANGLAAQILTLSFAPTQGYVGVYWATDGEIALHSYLLSLPQGVVPCMPVLTKDRQLGFAPWRPGDPVKHNRYGIPEPVVEPSSLLNARDLALVVMPLVGFDPLGNRLGMGGGWYDRTFAFRQSQSAPPYLVGVGYDEQEFLQGDVQPQSWDVQPDAICTPTRQILMTRN